MAKKHIISQLGAIIVLMILSWLFGVAVSLNFFNIRYLNPVFHKIICEDNSNPVVIIVCSIAFVAASFFFMKRLSENINLSKYLKTIAPIVFFCLYLVGFSHGFWEPILFVMVMTVTVFRLSLIMRLPLRVPLIRCSSRMVLISITGLFFLFAVYGFALQRKALDVMYFTFYDWGEFLTIAENSLKGNWFVTNVTVPGRNFLSVHFAPGSLLLMIAYVWIFPGVNAFFVMNSALIYTMPPLTYVLARKLKLSKDSSLILSIAAFLSPSLANLNLTSFHGFHVISFMIPTLLIFFILLEKKHFSTAFFVFLFSLTIKETVGAFWVGMGIILFIEKYRKLGITVSIIGGLYMVLAMKFFMPPVPGVSGYMFLDRYGHLGSTLSEVALSPIIRPSAFWGSLMRTDCVYFILLLILPFFVLVIRRPLLFLGALVTLAFICVQQSTRFQNISAQYQTEAMTLACICAVYATADIMRNRRIWVDQIFSLGIDCYISRRRRLFAALSATLCSALLCNCFFAENDWSKNSFSLQRKKKDWTKEIAEVRSLIPKDVAMNATYHLAPHFISRNDVYASLDGPLDYVLLDLDDPYNYPHKLMNLRKKLLESDKYDVACNRAFSNNHFMLFVPAKGAPKHKRTPRIFHLTDKQWPFTGNEVNVPGADDFSFRAALRKDNNRRYIMLFTRLKRKIDYDIKITAVISDGSRQLFYANYFGDALQPAYMRRPGDVYLMLLPVPADWSQVKSCQVKVDRKRLR